MEASSNCFDENQILFDFSSLVEGAGQLYTEMYIIYMGRSMTII